MAKEYRKKPAELIQKPVCISLNDRQLARIDARCEQTQLNRSKQIQRDLSVYWNVLDYGFREAQKSITLSECKYLLTIFRGRTPAAQDDVLWIHGDLTKFVRNSARFLPEFSDIAETLAQKISHISCLARLAIMDWIRRGAVNLDDESLYEGWKADP